MELKDPSYPLLWSQHTPASRMAFGVGNLRFRDVFSPTVVSNDKKNPGLVNCCINCGGVTSTQLYIGIITNHEIRIPINKPVFHVESKAAYFSWLK